MNIRQISVFLENRPGQLAQITALLYSHNINLVALNVAETQDYGVLRIITEDTEKAVSLLSENGYITTVNPVVCVVVPDTPGSLCRILDIISRENVDIEYMYSIMAHSDGNACMAFRAKEPGEIERVLSKNGICIATSQILGIK